MKNYFLVLLMSTAGISFSISQAVTRPYLIKIDSIQQLLSGNIAEDTTKIGRLYDLAFLYLLDMQYDSSLIAANEVRQLSQKIKYAKGEGLYLNYMMIFSGMNIPTVPFSQYYFYKKALFYADIRHKEEPFNILGMDAQQRDYEKNSLKLIEVHNYFEKENNKEMMAFILAAISSHYQILNKTNENILYTDQAVKLFNETGHRSLSVLLLLSKIAVLEQMGQTKNALAAEFEARNLINDSVIDKETALLDYMMLDNYQIKKPAVAVEYGLKSDKILLQMNDSVMRPQVITGLGIIYNIVSINKKAVEYLKKAAELKKNSTVLFGVGLEWIYNKIAFTLIEMKEYDEANTYIEKAKRIIDTLVESYDKHIDLAQHYDAMGQVLMGQGKYNEALSYFFKAVHTADTFHLYIGYYSYFNYYIANCYQKLGNLNESINYAKKSYEVASKFNTSDGIRVTLKSSLLLSEVYGQLKQPLEAYPYLNTYIKLRKSLDESDAANALANMEIQEILVKSENEKNQLEKVKLLQEKKNQNQRWWLLTIAGALFTSVVLMYVLFRNNKAKQQVNTVLKEKNNVIEQTLKELKSTQTQLIQSEKMASLGELTAGIAHEIQNPLNFVNNFSELNSELIKELEEEASSEQRDTKNETELITAIKENSEKINQHGHRASSIVKGMLEHSRKSSGEKELTDINALCDEYLRLSFHGLRAKDKNFNAEYKTDFDPNMPKINVVSQDIARVLLNLINNAFQATAEKNLLGLNRGNQNVNLVGLSDIQSEYKPLVTVNTKYLGDKIEISITDNGPGIPDSIRDKIFQPFFTTKPTGQGTGLGLSLAYDIVKAHGGSIEVKTNYYPPSGEIVLESKENEARPDDPVGRGTSFTIKLPML